MDVGASLGTILGGGLGAIARLIPEGLKFFDRKAERKHELDLQSAQLEVLKFQEGSKIEEARIASDNSQMTASIQALMETNKAQLAKTGVGWVDAANALVRPVWTYLVLLSWASAKIIDVAMCVARHMDWVQIRTIMWGADDATMLATLSTFWFMDRVLKYQKQ